MVVLGTRPEIVKLAPIWRELTAHSDLFKTELVWSGQHLELAKPFLDAFKLNPDYCFDIMIPNQSSTDICTAAMQKLADLFASKKPDLVIVQGDTTTAFVAALTAFYHKIPVAHVEAGLRSGDPDQPFPEEKNRKLISHLAKWHFAPTLQSRENLLREGVDPQSIYVVGNTVVDSLQWLLKKYPPPANPYHKLLVVTAHRQENFGEPLEHICSAIQKLVKHHKDLQIIFPVHLNPKVRQTVFERLGNTDRIQLVDPLDYISFIHLLTHSYAVLTDSGGVQEEAPCLGKPVLILRDVTERPEGILQGASRLAGRKTAEIFTSVDRLLCNTDEYQKMAKIRYPFGRGNSAKKIIETLKIL